jgi:hypothetical protein
MKFGTQQIYRLKSDQVRYEQDCVFIYGDTLFCAIRYNKKYCRHIYKDYDDDLRDSKIYVVDLITQKVKAKYYIDNCLIKINAVVANDDYIVVHTESLNRYYDYFVIVIYRHTGKYVQVHLISPAAIPLNGYCNLNLSGHLLSVCFRADSSLDRDTYCLYDLSSEKQKKISFDFHGPREMSFQDGRFVIIETQNENPSIYVEDSQQVNGDLEENLVDPRKWKRRK